MLSDVGSITSSLLSLSIIVSIIEAHKYGIKMPIGIQDDSDNQRFDFNLEDFNLLSNDFD